MDAHFAADPQTTANLTHLVAKCTRATKFLGSLVDLCKNFQKKLPEKIVHFKSSEVIGCFRGALVYTPEIAEKERKILFESANRTVQAGASKSQGVWDEASDEKSDASVSSTVQAGAPRTPVYEPPPSIA